ncbi:U3 small nucleolar RNA-associated protein 15-like protein, partial [Leptotrombidium deliense]
MEVIRTYNTMSHFSVFGAKFRKSDYKLVVCGTEEGKINIYDVKGNRPLKFLSNNPKSKHLGPIHCCSFMSDHQICSASDDKTVKLWDLASGELIRDIGVSDASVASTVKPHMDYIRALCVVPDSQLIVSGSYDHRVKVWDSRDSNETPKFSFSLECPVEDVIHRGSLLLACGAKKINIYDLIAGKLIKSIENTHSKTITSLYNYDKFVLSSSLDGHVKIYDSLFNVVTSLSFAPSQLLSLCVNSNTLVVGANDGLVISRNFKSVENNDVKQLQKNEKQKRYFTWLREEAAKEEQQMEVEDEAVIVKKRANTRQFLQRY